MSSADSLGRQKLTLANMSLVHCLPAICQSLRNTPIKKADGTTFLRADIQHNLLLEIFSDTTRCFRNPRPAPEGSWTQPPKAGESAATGIPEYSPVYPYGQAKGTTRRSNETPEEYAAWEERYKEYQKNPYPTREEDPEGKVPRPGAKLLTFKELYIEALMNSTRCTKAVRDKVWADETYAEDFACVNLLINIGRMNTTLAFFAQMQTVLRSYHPLPCLQVGDNSRKHMQDAPRMKSLLKSVLLPFEKASTGPGSVPISKTAQAAIENAVPAHELLELAGNLDEVLSRYRDGHVPSTSVVNLIFIIATQAPELTSMHFMQPHDAHSIFFPHKDHPIPGRDRAKAFLWLVWHYYEGAALLPPGNETAMRNPFADDQAKTAATRARAKWDGLDEKGRRKATVSGKGVLWLGVRNRNATAANSAPAPGEDPDAGSSTPAAAETDAHWDVEENERYTHRQLAPAMRTVSQEEIRQENLDVLDELKWGAEQCAERRYFMAQMAEEERQKALAGGDPASSGKGKGKGKGRGTAMKGKGKKGKRASMGVKAEDEPAKAAGVGRGKGRGKRKASLAAGDTSLAGKRRRLSGPGDASMATDYGDELDATELLDAAVAATNGDQQDSFYDELGGDDPEGAAASAALANLLKRHQSSGGRLGQGLPPKRPLTMTDIEVGLRDDAEAATSGQALDEQADPSMSTGPTSLASYAWNRILQRALRGQGDACYASDDEDSAMDEAQRCGEMFRGELSRVLSVVWKSGGQKSSAAAGRRASSGAAAGDKKKKGSAASSASTAHADASSTNAARKAATTKYPYPRPLSSVASR